MPADVLDEELAVGLRQARKKARNFAIVVKGSKPLKLIVKKKPIKPPELVEAKAEVKGSGYLQGVCQGSGTEMVFKLVGEEPGVKTIQLKELIAEQTGLTMKPRFELVTELPEIDEDEDEELEAEGADEEMGALPPTAPPSAANTPRPAPPTAVTPTAATPPPAPPPAPPKPAQDGAAAFSVRLKALKPRIDQAITSGEGAAAAVKAQAAEMARLAKIPDFPAAGEVLDKIEKLLAQGGAPPVAPSPAPPAPPPASGESDLAKLFTDRLKGIKPDLDRALATGNAVVPEIKAHAAAMSAAAKQKDFAKAHEELDAAEPLIRKALAGPTPSEELKQSGADLALTKDRARFAAARGVWVRVRDQVVANIRTISANMAAEYEADEEMTQNVAAGVTELESVAARFNDDLKAKFDEFIQDPPPPPGERERIKREALALIEGYRKQVESDSIYDDLDEQEFSDALVKAPLLATLTSLAKDLA